MKMSTNRFLNLTKKQLAVFEQIAINKDLSHNSKTLDSLEKKGLIESYEQSLNGSIPCIIKRYEVPINIHMQWCKWCSENYTEED
jgi:hypothetical protein